MQLNYFKEKYGIFRFDEDDFEAKLKVRIKASQRKIVVLDDDPTGIQTVHGISVFTDWTVESLTEGLMDENPVFYVLTNSRSLSGEETARLHKELAQNLKKAQKECGRQVMVISRSDSTLRGHYPLETEILKEALEDENSSFDGEILIPFFKEGGRLTIEDIHYVAEGDVLVPAAETEFASDKTFGYQSSDLKDYVEEKSGGKYRRNQVIRIGLDDLRAGNTGGITARLMEAEGFQKIIVNAMEDADLLPFCMALYDALAAGKQFLFRTAASFVRVVGGISKKPLLTGQEICREACINGGIVVIGSHTKKTTRQLEALCGMEGLVFIEFASHLVLEDRLDEAVTRTVKAAEECIISGQTAVIYTGRQLLSCPEDTKEEALKRSVKISEAVRQLVDQLTVRPAFIIAKGGITSSDIGVKALKVKKARAHGQIQPGIPVWQTGPESKFPGISYVIFPGNVGQDDTLRKVIETLLFKHSINSNIGALPTTNQEDYKR